MEVCCSLDVSVPPLLPMCAAGAAGRPCTVPPHTRCDLSFQGVHPRLPGGIWPSEREPFNLLGERDQSVHELRVLDEGARRHLVAVAIEAVGDVRHIWRHREIELRRHARLLALEEPASADIHGRAEPAREVAEQIGGEDAWAAGVHDLARLQGLRKLLQEELGREVRRSQRAPRAPRSSLKQRVVDALRRGGG
eukprot:2577695-Prymnesium_polylepis.1